MPYFHAIGHVLQYLRLPKAQTSHLCPCIVRLVAGPAPPKAEALEAPLRVLIAEPKGTHLAGGALLALCVGLAAAGAVAVALALALLVALVLNGARGVAVAGATVGEIVVAGGASVTEGALIALQAAADTGVQVALV